MVKYPLLIGGIFLIFGLIFLLVLVYPKYQEFKILKEKIRGKETEFSQRTAYYTKLQRTFQKIQNYQSQISKINMALPEKIFMPEILDFIQKNASQAGLLLKDMNPKTIEREIEEKKGEEAKKSLKETEIEVKLTGNYSSFKNFLSILEKSARLFEVEKISLSSEKEGEFDLEIKVFSY